MFRKLLALALVIVALHVAAVLTLGTSPAGSLIGNLLQITACGLAVAAAFAASRRATGLSRRFWLLVGCGLAVWGLADIGWMYYEIVLRMEPPTGSIVRFLFGTQSIFFALAVFLNQDQRRVDAGPGVRAGLRADHHRFIFYLYRILLHTFAPPGCAHRVHSRDVDGVGRGPGAGVAGRSASDARAIEPDSRAVSGFCGVSAGLHSVRGRRGLRADDQGLADGNMVRPWVDHAAAGGGTVGGELAAIAGDTESAASAAKKIWRAAARQRHTGAGAADRTAAGSAIRDGMARGAVHAAGRFDCVLRRAIGGHAIPAEPDRGYAATPQSGHGLRGERNRDCGRERTTHLRERGIRANGGARECGVHRRPAVEGCLRTPGRRASGRGDPRVNAEEGQVVWADDYSPARRERVAGGDGGYAFAGRRRGVRQPGHDGQAGGRKRARASGGEIPHAGRASGGHQLHRGAGHSRRMALCQPAGGNDVWIFGGRVADGFAGVDAARPSGGPQDRGGRGRSEQTRGAFSGGVPRGPQGWPRDLGERHRGGSGWERCASVDGRNHRGYHGTQATGDATAASAAHGGHRQAGGRNRA